MPSIIRLPQDYAVRTKNIYVQDALATIGEECIALSMYHLVNDEFSQPRCPVCFDDVYGNASKFECAECFGTTFLDGVKKAQRVFAVFTDSPNTEVFAKRGENALSTHQVQIEAAPLLRQNDYLVRVIQWQTVLFDGMKIITPKIYGSIFRLDAVQEVTLRTGARYGQTIYDKIGQKATATEQLKSHPIYDYIPPEPILRVDEVIVP